MSSFCNQCEMSAPDGCGSSGATTGTCGKDETLSRIQDIIIYGVKGISAYRYLAGTMDADTKKVDDVISEAMYFTLTNVNFNLNDHVNMMLKVGSAAVEMMKILDETHTTRFGTPEPVEVSQNKIEGQCILVSGHDLLVIKELLEQTKDSGINVYTHSEMLPAHAYPELKKYKHLKGNVGKAWFDQSKLFENFPGTILLNTNCIVPAKSSTTYQDRLFTMGNVNIEGMPESNVILNYDFTNLIKKTLSLSAVNIESNEKLTTGHHWKTVLGMADQILDAVSSGKIKRFFVVAGCDAPGKAGDYFRELALNIPEDCIIITSSCGKFRFNDHNFGNIKGTFIPRYLDMGQCNDSGGAVQIALALAGALKCGVNDLPLSIVLSWMEQKAVAILLGLFSLGIKDIRLGPKPPQFVNETIVNYLVENFNFKLTTTAQEDLKSMLAGDDADLAKSA